MIIRLNLPGPMNVYPTVPLLTHSEQVLSYANQGDAESLGRHLKRTENREFIPPLNLKATPSIP